MDNVEEECVYVISEIRGDDYLEVDPIDIMPECYNGLKRSNSPAEQSTTPATSAPPAKKRRRRRKAEQNFAAMAVDMKRQIQELKRTIERNESTNAARYNTLLEKHEALVKQTDATPAPSSSLSESHATSCSAPADLDNTLANEVESESDDDGEDSLEDERYRALSDKLDTVLSEVLALSQKNNVLFDLVKSLKVKVFKSIEFDGSISPPKLPLRKTVEVDQLNKSLEDEKFLDQMVLRLSPFCVGVSLTTKVRQLMEKLMDYRLTVLYTWTGKQALNKCDNLTHSFATKRNILKMVISCVRYQDNEEIMNKDIINAIHEYVRRAKEVCRARNKLLRNDANTSNS